MKKILIISYYWPPSGGSGVQRWVKFVKYLPAFGIEPVVLTVEPASATYPVVDDSLADDIPAGIKVCHTKSREPFKLYQKLSGKREIPHSGFANEPGATFAQKVMRFIRGNFFIPDARKGWNRFAFEKARQLITELDIKTVITTSPPHSSQLIGLKLKNEMKINWIADLRDPWTDIYYYRQMYHTPIAKKIDLNYEHEVLTNADGIIVVSEAIKNQLLLKDAALPPAKFSVIPNGFDNADFSYPAAKRSDKFIITYTGTVATNYHIESYLKAVLKLSEETGKGQILLRFVGVVAGRYKNLIQNTALQGITEYVGHVEHAQSIQYLLQSTVLFLAIPDVDNNEGILTGKLFEYLGAKKTIVGVGPVNGDAAQIITECKAGEMFDYHDQEQIFKYLLKLYKSWKDGDNLTLHGYEINAYERKSLAEKLAALLKD